jgi:carboxylesterase
MAEQNRQDPSPFFLDGGPIGVLLIHGFTGSPPEMRLLGEYLNKRGLTVSGPLLTGHGTTVDDLNRCSWSDWTAKGQEALEHLRQSCKAVFVGGLSMGSLVSIYVAAHDGAVAGTALYACPVLLRDRSIQATPILKHLIRKIPKSGKSHLVDPAAESQLWHYSEYPISAAHELLKLVRRARKLLPNVTCPLLAIQAAQDHHVHPRSGSYIMRHVGSADKELLVLDNSSHLVTIDAEWDRVAEKTYRFIQDHSS